MIPASQLQQISTCLKKSNWKKLIEPTLLQRGKKIFNSTNVKLLRSTKHKDYFIIDFEVIGSHPYDTSIAIYDDSDIAGTCDCLYPHTCKHIAAALFKIESLSNKPKKQTPPNKQSIEKWINQLQETLKEDPKTTQINNDLTVSKNTKTRVIYLLQPHVYLDNIYQIKATKANLLKNGTYSIQSSSITHNLNEYNIPKYISPLDLEILLELSANHNLYGYIIESRSSSFARILEKCGTTNRLFIPEPHQDKKLTPFTFTQPRQLMPNWEASSTGTLKPSVKLTPPASTILETYPQIFIDKTTREIGLIEQSHSDSFLSQWLNGPTLTSEQATKITPLISKIEPVTTNPTPKPTTKQRNIPSPPSQIKITKAKPIPTLSIQSLDLTPEDNIFLNAKLLDVITGQISFSYDGVSIPAKTTKPEIIVNKDNVINTIKRNVSAEKKWLKTLNSTELIPTQMVFSEAINNKYLSSYLFSDNKTANTTQWINFLAAHEETLKKLGWNIETIGDLGYSIQEYDDIFEDLGQSDNNWFKFDLGILHNGKKISLIPAIANAIQSGMFKNYNFPTHKNAKIPIPLENNQYIYFPAARFKEILEKIQDLFQHINDRGEIEIPHLRAATLVDDLDLAKTNQTLTNLAELGSKIKNIDGLPKTRVPKNLNAELRDYQKIGFQWLQFLATYNLNGVLADDMGLGKTLQTLTHLLAEKNSKTKNTKKLPSLVIAPTSVIPNWHSEAKKFTPSLKILPLHGLTRHEHFNDIKKHDIILTSYALLQRDQDIHLKQDYHIIILDESQYIKNAATKTTKVANKLKANQRICLSGTPMENHLGELWSTFNFLMPGLLQSYKAFNTTFRRPIEKDGNSDIQNSLSRRVSPLILRRTKDVVAKELPPKTIIPHYITLNEEQIDLYEIIRASMDKRVKDAIKDKGFNKSQILILDALLKLRQICCHPQLLKTAKAKKIKNSAKLDYLTQLLTTFIKEKRSILIFSQFTSMLKIIEEHLIKNNIPFVKITGNTKDRQTPVDQFQKGKIPIFLISLKAGGTGLNLTKADTVIHYDPWWNPAVENQATDRAYRIGQKNPVFVHKLICKGTIEEQIQTLQEQKAELVESLLSNSTNKFKLDQNTLSGLLAPIET